MATQEKIHLTETSFALQLLIYTSDFEHRTNENINHKYTHYSHTALHFILNTKRLESADINSSRNVRVASSHTTIHREV